MHGFASQLVVGVEQGFLQQPSDVTAADLIDDSAPVTRAFHQSGEPQLRQMLAGNRRTAPSRRGQGGDVDAAVTDRPQQSDPGRVRQQGERRHRGRHLL